MHKLISIFCEIWDTTEFGPGWDSNSQPSDLCPILASLNLKFMQKLIFLHLFTDLFHKDFSSLVRINCSYFMYKNIFTQLH